MRRVVITLLLLTLTGFSSWTFAETLRAPQAKPSQDTVLPKEWVKSTKHKLRFATSTIQYEARIGELHLKDRKGKPKAAIFYTAYFKKRGDQGRPVTFVFNGGPGSSSVWLHMGLMGPKVVAFKGTQAPPPAPYQIVANPHSPFLASDMVFIDPVGTGFSRPLGEHKLDEFLSVQADVQSVGDFIVRFLNEHNLWNRPKFLAGESYGTTRAAALVNHLQNRGVAINGVVLISPILNFQTARFAIGNDTPYPLFLPTYAATAWFHKKVTQDIGLADFVEKARRFATQAYWPALIQGDRLADDAKRKIANELATLTGIRPEFWLQSNLRIPIWRFVKELRRDEGLTVGRLDTRFTGFDRDNAGESFEFDPSYAAILGPYTAAVNHYFRAELGLEENREYEILSFKVNREWKWHEKADGFVNVAEDLRQAMTRNPNLRILIACGYYDLATPFFAAEYTVDHMQLPEALRNNIRFHYYPAGHMMYIHPPSLKSLSDTLNQFYHR